MRSREEIEKHFDTSADEERIKLEVLLDIRDLLFMQLSQDGRAACPPEEERQSWVENGCLDEQRARRASGWISPAKELESLKAGRKMRGRVG